MVDSTMREVEKIWPSIADVLYVPHNEAEYDRLVTILHRLVREVHGEEPHPLDAYMEIVGTLVDAYERDNFPGPDWDLLV